MTRKVTLITAIVMSFGFVVAAQDSSPDGDYSEDRQLRSVLKKSFRGREASPALRSQPATTSHSPSQSSGVAVGTGVREGVSARSPLVDRLKQIRGATIGDNRVDRTSPLGSPTRVEAVPQTASPRSSDPSQFGRPAAPGFASEPRLLPGQLGGGGGLEAAGESQFQAPPTRGVLADRNNSARRSRPLETTPAPISEPGRVVPNTISEHAEHGYSIRSEEPQQIISQHAIPAEPAEQNGPVALLSSQGPAVLVDTIGPPAIVVGQEAEYRITLTNQSRVGANDVFVRIALPTWVEITAAEASVGGTQVKASDSSAQELIWKATQFAPGAREVLSLKVNPRENRSFNLAVDWTLRPVTAVAQIQVQQPELQMAVFGPDRIGFGETAVYTIQLSNPGTGRAEDVMVDFGYGSEQLPPRRIGVLAAGETTDVRVELTARQAGLLRVAANATAAGGLSAESAKEVQVQRAKLEVVVLGSKMLFAGTAAHYDFQVRNAGDAEAVNVMAEVVLPPGAQHASQAGQRNGETVSKQLGTISPGSERRFRLTCQLTNPGENLIEARATAAGNLHAADTFVTRVEAIADLKMNVNDAPGPIPVDTETVYELHIVNRGTRAAKDIKVVAQFSEGVEPVSANGTVARIIPGQVLFQTIPRIQPGEEIRLRITAKADVAGNHRFRAELKCADPAGTVLSEEESTYFFADDVSTATRPSPTSVK